jgi:anti-anti-sigma factor
MPLILESRFCENVFILECKGQIVIGQEVKELEASLRMATREFTRVVLAIGQVTRLDSIGLGLLVRSVDGLRKRGGNLRLADPPAFVSHLLMMTKLTEFLQSYSSEDDAIVSFLTETAEECIADPPGHRVLVIERSPDFGAFVRAVLGQHGYQVRSASLISDARMLLRFQSTDYILFGPSSPLAAVEAGTASLQPMVPRAMVLSLEENFHTLDASLAAERLLELLQSGSASAQRTSV